GVAGVHKELAVVAVVQRVDLHKSAPLIVRGCRPEHVENHRVNILFGRTFTAVGTTQGRHVTQLAIGRGELHDIGRNTANVGNPQGGGSAKLGLSGGLAANSVKVQQVGTDSGAQVAGVEIPLAGDVARRRGRGDDIQPSRVA